MAIWSTELTTGCFARAEADEPMFVLLSRDRLAPWLVMAWAFLRTCQIFIGTKPVSDFERVDEARALARQMRAWRKANPKRTRNRAAAKQHSTVAEAGIDVPVVGEPTRIGTLSWPALGRTSNVSELGVTGGESAASNSTSVWRHSNDPTRRAGH